MLDIAEVLVGDIGGDIQDSGRTVRCSVRVHCIDKSPVRQGASGNADDNIATIRNPQNLIDSAAIGGG